MSCGWVLGNGTHLIKGTTDIINNTQRGIMSLGGGKTTVEYSSIVNNGGASYSLTPMGGALQTEDSTLILGDSSSNGHNCIHGNEAKPRPGGGSVGREVANHRQGVTLKAQYNWWNTTNGDPDTNELVQMVCDNDNNAPCTTDSDCAKVCSGESSRVCTYDDQCEGAQTCVTSGTPGTCVSSTINFLNYLTGGNKPGHCN